MSSSDYRMNLVWTSHGEQLRADLERNIGGLVSFDRQVRGNSKNLGIWGQQMKAIGTTIRYAFAGAVAYGVASAVNNLSDFEAKLGDIDSLAGQLNASGKLVGLGKDLSGVGDYALMLSNKLGIAATDVQDTMTTFYSSFQPPRGQRGLEDMREFVDVASQLARATRATDPRSLAEGLAGMTYAFGGGNPRNARRFGNLLAQVEALSVGFTGEQLSQQTGRITQAALAGRMTPEQIFGVLTTASQSGGSPAVIARGITQLFSNILIPQGGAKGRVAQAYQTAGLPTDPSALGTFRYKGARGGLAVLFRMMDAVGPVRVANPQALNNIEDPEQAIGAAGATGVNLGLARNLFTRAESFRQFLSLMNRGPDSIRRFIDALNEGERNNVLAQRTRAAVQQSELQRARIAQANFNMTILRGFDPVFHAIASGQIGVSNFALRHPHAVTGAIAGTAAASLAARLITGTGLVGNLGRGADAILGRVPFGKGLLGRIGVGRALGRSGELAAASVVGAGLGALSSQGKGTRSDPIWAVIDPLSWFMPGAPNDTTGIGPAPGKQGGDVNLPKTTNLIKRLGPYGVAPLIAAPFAFAGYDYFRSNVGPGGQRMVNAQARVTRDMTLDTFLKRADPNMTWVVRKEIEHAFGKNPLAHPQSMAIEGDLRADFTVTMVDASGKVLKVEEKRGVPVKLTSLSAGKRPSFRGKAKTPRGSSSR